MPHDGPLGWGEDDVRRLGELHAGRFEGPEDICRVIDRLGYLNDWRADYRVRSARASLHSPAITCIDAAILSYGLLELLFSPVKRRLLAIQRRDQKGDECGHCVTLYWNDAGKVGAISKSNFATLGHRPAVFDDEFAMAASLARAYLAMGFEPLYFGVTTLEETAPDLDWRFAPGALNVLSERLQARYEFAFSFSD